MHKDAMRVRTFILHTAYQTQCFQIKYIMRFCGFLLIIFRGNLIYFYYDEIVE